MIIIRNIIIGLVTMAAIAFAVTPRDTSWTITTTTLLEDGFIKQGADSAAHSNTLDTMISSEEANDRTLWVRCLGIDTLLDSGMISNGIWTNYIFDSAYLQLTWRTNGTAGSDDSCNFAVNRVLKSTVAAEIDWDESKTGVSWTQAGAINIADRVDGIDDTHHPTGYAITGVSAAYTTKKFWLDTSVVQRWTRYPADSNQGLLIDAGVLINCTAYSLNCASEDNATAGNRPVFVVYAHYWPQGRNRLHAGRLHGGRIH
ncbi:MAG: hypothetical protein PHW53_04645 [Patescibacteria group bacterium]|nr:hypothetical protein [Patescibacteria group bacterium]